MTTVRPSLSFAVALVAGSSAALVIAAAAHAADPAAVQTQISQTMVSVAFEASSVEGVPDYLAGRLALVDGSAVADQPLTFWRSADFGGARTIELGTGSTDSGGIARIPIVPREERYRITVRFAGTNELAPSETVGEIAFPPETVIHPEHAPQGGVIDPRLRPLANFMPGLVGGAVALVWLVLFAVTAITLIRVMSEGRRR
ncbi:MAG TPA: hypothetical protein VJ141_01370 [Candidatus Limnocylindrales bacterium]|nr:hypothetical protein [Candidatus Limnocylindrales bacterium]